MTYKKKLMYWLFRKEIDEEMNKIAKYWKGFYSEKIELQSFQIKEQEKIIMNLKNELKKSTYKWS